MCLYQTRLVKIGVQDLVLLDNVSVINLRPKYDRFVSYIDDYVGYKFFSLFSQQQAKQPGKRAQS